MGSSFGVLFRITTFGESHGPGLGVVVDGCPAQLPLDTAAIQAALDRRRPGQSRLVSQRKEADQVEILSGVLDGVTLGTPIAMMIRNQDARSKDYDDIARAYRPSHADYTYDAKYGIRAVAGGGRASARETAGRVAAGAVARQLLAQRGVAIVAWVDEVAGIAATVDDQSVTRDAVDASDIRCPDAATAAVIPATSSTHATTVTPRAASSCCAIAPAATRPAVSRALARPPPATARIPYLAS